MTDHRNLTVEVADGPPGARQIVWRLDAPTLGDILAWCADNPGQAVELLDALRGAKIARPWVSNEAQNAWRRRDISGSTIAEVCRHRMQDWYVPPGWVPPARLEPATETEAMAAVDAHLRECGWALVDAEVPRG